MLARANRVVLGRDFRLTIRQGKKSTSREAVVSVFQTAQGSPVRFGVVTGKAVGNAVVRNLVRRRVRAAARGIVDDGVLGFDVVVRALPGAQNVTVEQWSELCRRALAR